MTATTGPWVCGNCRSVNREGDGRCYSCRTPKGLALNPEAREPTRRPADDASLSPAAQATTARSLGARYRSSGGLAGLTQVAVLIVTAITLARTVLTIAAIKNIEGLGPDATDEAIDAALDQLVVLGLLTYVNLGAWVLGLVAWGAWLSRAVANVPALGGGWTAETPRFAFLSTLIPGGNLYWTTSTMRQVIVGLSPKGQAGLGILSAWWLTLTPMLILLLNVGPLRLLRNVIDAIISVVLLVLSGGDVTSLLDATVLAEIVGAVLLVASALLAVALIQSIETLQAERGAALGAATGS